MCIRFSPDNYYVMSMGGDDRSAMQWRVLPAAHDDVVVDKPAFSEYQVYQPPKKAAVVMDEPLVGPRVDAKALGWHLLWPRGQGAPVCRLFDPAGSKFWDVNT